MVLLQLFCAIAQTTIDPFALFYPCVCDYACFTLKFL